MAKILASAVCVSRRASECSAERVLANRSSAGVLPSVGILCIEEHGLANTTLIGAPCVYPLRSIQAQKDTMIYTDWATVTLFSICFAHVIGYMTAKVAVRVHIELHKRMTRWPDDLVQDAWIPCRHRHVVNIHCAGLCNASVSLQCWHAFSRMEYRINVVRGSKLARVSFYKHNICPNYRCTAFDILCCEFMLWWMQLIESWMYLINYWCDSNFALHYCFNSASSAVNGQVHRWGDVGCRQELETPEGEDCVSA